MPLISLGANFRLLNGDDGGDGDDDDDDVNDGCGVDGNDDDGDDGRGLAGPHQAAARRSDNDALVDRHSQQCGIQIRSRLARETRTDSGVFSFVDSFIVSPTTTTQTPPLIARVAL